MTVIRGKAAVGGGETAISGLNVSLFREQPFAKIRARSGVRTNQTFVAWRQPAAI